MWGRGVTVQRVTRWRRWPSLTGKSLQDGADIAILHRRSAPFSHMFFAFFFFKKKKKEADCTFFSFFFFRLFFFSCRFHFLCVCICLFVCFVLFCFAVRGRNANRNAGSVHAPLRPSLPPSLPSRSRLLPPPSLPPPPPSKPSSFHLCRRWLSTLLKTFKVERQLKSR